MNTQDKIDKLKSEIDSLKREQSNCSHRWDKPMYDPEKVMVQDDRGGYEEHGSDRWPVPSFHEESKDRWSRECIKCGIKEYTYKQEPVTTELKPKF